MQQNILVALLVALYGLGLGQFQGSLGLPFEQLPVEANNITAHYFAAPTLVDVYALPAVDGGAVGVQYQPYSTLKNVKYWVYLPAPFEYSFRHTFKHLERATLALMLRHRMAELLFPAHFFW